MPFWRKGNAQSEPSRFFFASDIHGSETTFRKFLNAAKNYKVDSLIFGGDLMGKALVPIVRADKQLWDVHDPDGKQQVTSEEDLLEVKRRLLTLGYYWWTGEKEEYEEIRASEERIEDLFNQVARRRLEDWLQLAEDRLSGTSVRMYLCGGNDDTEQFLRVLDDAQSEHVIACDNRVVPLDERHEMVTLGLSTPTPWNTPRERPDSVIREELERLMGEVSDPARCVLNVHVPPIDSTLDRCIKLDTSTWPPAPVFERGQPVYIGAGSEAVTEVINKYQPMLGLHGHIHESRGTISLKGTPAFNAGSEYAEGILRGLIIAIRDSKVSGYQFTSG